MKTLDARAVAVEHVGSTSVPGLAAKPIIDLEIVVASASLVPMAIEGLAKLGYAHRGDLGIEGREAFDSPSGLPAHHLYVCVLDNTALKNHLTIRDYLRRHSAAAEKYGNLKKKLARQFPTDIDRYSAAKTDFLLEVLRQTGLSDRELTANRDANRISKG